MAGGNVKTFITAGILTILLFLSIYILNMLIEAGREDEINTKMNEVIEEFEEIESSYYLMEYLTETNSSCDAIIDHINYLEQRLWKLDHKIKEYRDMMREFGGEEFYLKEKRRLNRRAIIHLSMLTKVKKLCSYNKTVILYFYGNCRTDPKCGQQGFVLSYINEQIDPEIAILSFDADRNVEVVRTLMKAHNITHYPCLIIEGHTHCGLKNRDELVPLLCNYSPHISICEKPK